MLDNKQLQELLLQLLEHERGASRYMRRPLAAPFPKT